MVSWLAICSVPPSILSSCAFLLASIANFLLASSLLKLVLDVINSKNVIGSEFLVFLTASGLKFDSLSLIDAIFSLNCCALVDFELI